MKRSVMVAIAVIAAVVLLVLAIPALVNVNEFRPRIEAMLSAALGRQVTLGELSFSIFSGSLRARDLTIAEDSRFGSGSFVRAKSLVLGVEVWPLLTSRQLNITDLTIAEPEFNLTQGADGVWNFSTIGSKGATAGPKTNLSVKLIALSNGKLTWTQAGAKPAVIQDLNISVKNFAAGLINPSDASATPVQMGIKMSGVALDDAGASGILNVDGAASLTGETLAWKGAIQIEQAKFVPQGTAAKQPVTFLSTLQYNLKDHSGVLTQGDIHFSNASASLTGSYAAQLNLHLKGAAMPVSAVAAMMPSLNIELPAGSRLEGGTAAIDAMVTGSIAAPVIDASVGVSNTKLTGFDLGTQLGAIERLAGIQPAQDTVIQTLSASLRANAQGTAIRALKLDAPALGELNGTGTLTPRHALDLKMAITLRSGLMNVALGRKTALPFFVRGTASHPSFEPDVAGIAAAEINRLGNGIFGRKK